MRMAGIREARRVARALVYRFGITAPEHVRIESIAKRLGARVVETKLDGADAQLVAVNGDARIMVSDRVRDRGAIQFGIGHELGHFVLGHPTMPPYMLRSATPRPTNENERDYEAEANAFASEITMPYVLVNRWCDVSPVTLDVAWRVAKEFSMSILAASRRVVELSPERCAAVFSSNRHVVWTSTSETFTRLIERGRRLDQNSVAWDFFDNGALDERAQQVPADAWFDTSVEVDIFEHATASIEYGTVLSMLWVPDRVAASLGMFL
jgi:Zn-dependent peptidase ImmA (M78 family)